MRENSEREISLVGHLSELRTRLIISIMALFIGMVSALFVSSHVIDFLTYPVRNLNKEPDRNRELTFIIGQDRTVRLSNADFTNFEPLIISKTHYKIEKFNEDTQTTKTAYIGEKPNQGVYARDPLAGFMVPIKVSFVIGILLALPVILYQIWLFVMPGLKPKEKQLVRPLLSAAVFLFPIGAMFAFLMIMMMMKVMQRYMPASIEPLIGIDEYLSLVVTLMVIFGLIFELPLVVAIGARIGIITPEMLMRYRRQAYILLTVAAAILTPADPFSMIVGLIPLIILYELSILVARPMSKLRRINSTDV